MRLMCFLLLLSSVVSTVFAETKLTADWAEQYIKENQPNLMLGSESDHVVSVYYFGKFRNRSLLGLERVRGEGYEQFFTLLIFENKSLLGFYENVLSFPSAISAKGEVAFPFGISGQIKASGKPLMLDARAFADLCQTQSRITQCFAWQPTAYKNLK